MPQQILETSVHVHGEKILRFEPRIVRENLLLGRTV